MARRPRSNRNLVWADTDPLSRSIIAAFSGRVGPGPGDLNETAFAASLCEVFLDFESDDIRIQLGRAGLGAVRGRIIQELQKSESVTVVAGLVRTLSGLAGRNQYHPQYWAGEARQAITSGTVEEAESTLQNMTTVVAQYIETD